eukprot:RCo016145
MMQASVLLGSTCFTAFPLLSRTHTPTAPPPLLPVLLGWACEQRASVARTTPNALSAFPHLRPYLSAFFFLLYCCNLQACVRMKSQVCSKLLCEYACVQGVSPPFSFVVIGWASALCAHPIHTHLPPSYPSLTCARFAAAKKT